MKTNIKNLAISAFMLSSLLVASSCQKESSANANKQYASILNVASDGQTDVISNNLKLALVSTSNLTSSDVDILLKAKDEEKLAHDVYTVLGAKWSSQVFLNITRAESTHLSAVIYLLAVNGSAETNLAPLGEFSNPAIKNLYDILISKGNLSLGDALQVGASIEELDIRDLILFESQTTNANITLVFENLLKGSRNHLRAFNRQLTTLGITYTPQYLEATTYQTIISATFEKGNQYRMGNGQGKGGMRGSGTCMN